MSTLEIPTDPGVREEFLWVINTIEKERQRTPNGEPIAYPVPNVGFIAPGVPSNEEETLILRKLQTGGLIRIVQKEIPIDDPYAVYDGTRIIRAVHIPNLKQFAAYRDALTRNDGEIKFSADYAEVGRAERTFSFEDERREIESITLAEDHRLARDRWLNIKRVLDAIYKVLSPFVDGTQTIFLNQGVIPPEQQPLLASILLDMFKADVATLVPQKSSAVITSEPARKFISGEEVVITSRKSFENYRKSISELYGFIEEDGRNRFPSHYATTLSKPLNTSEVAAKKLSHKLPAGSKWQDVEIKFESKYDIQIYIKKKLFKKTNYEELGFSKSGTKEKDPDIQWDFLRSLSAVQHIKPEEATVEKMAEMLGKLVGKKITKEACAQAKSKLSKKLQETLGINDDPFFDYGASGYYQTKFKLEPEPELRGDGEVFTTKTRYDDKKEYREEDADSADV